MSSDGTRRPPALAGCSWSRPRPARVRPPSSSVSSSASPASGCRGPIPPGGRRPGENDQVDYNFITREAFEAMIRRGDFLEWADVFGDYYGTGNADTARALVQGDDVVLVIDVQGARQVQAVRAACRHDLRAATIVRGARTTPARPEPGQRRDHPSPARRGVERSSRVRGLRLCGRERRAGGRTR